MRQSLQGVVALARGDEFERRERPDGLEHPVQRTIRQGGLGSQQQALVDQTGRRAQHVVAAGRGTLATGKDGCGGLDRKSTRQRAETAERALLDRAK